MGISLPYSIVLTVLPSRDRTHFTFHLPVSLLLLWNSGRAPKAILKGGMTVHCSAKRDFITKLMNSANLHRTDPLSLSSLRCDGTAASCTEEIGCMHTVSDCWPSCILKVCLRMQLHILHFGYIFRTSGCQNQSIIGSHINTKLQMYNTLPSHNDCQYAKIYR